MGALGAIVMDTWRQSRQQIVLLIMLAILALLAIVPPIIATPVELTDEEGQTEEHLRLLNIEESEMMLEGGWAFLYAQSVLFASMDDDDQEVDPFSPEGQELQLELAEVALLEAQTPPLRRGVEVLLYGISGFIFSTSMMLFIAAASAYYPSMLEAGAIDIVLAKPLERWKVFLGKFLGGMALFTAAIVACNLLLYLGIGLRTGVFHAALFLVMPLQIVSATTIFALLALLGVVTRKTNFSMITGYLYYLVIDSILGVLAVIPFEVSWLDKAQTALRWSLPNFGQLKAAATLSVINMPAMNWQPVIVACGWIVLSLSVGYWKFRNTDY
ncbi:MAG: ABC transporter permease subunit [Myxococcales bacterium]|nr:ABC transporter permease subunit [Myxococcales bacterium]